MGKARIATGVVLVTLVTGAMGYTIALVILLRSPKTGASSVPKS
jgi:hypothetical protein